MQEYLGLFLDESRENLQALNASILDLEREPDDPIEALNTIFRVAHSLKGMSATMGFERMAGLTHRMEEVLSKLRDGHAPPADLAGICQRFSDALARFGYPPCPGGIMVSNPAWRMAASEFAQTTRRWLAMPEGDSLMNLAIFMDAHAVSGDASLLQQVRGSLTQMAVDNDAMLARFAGAIDAFGGSIGWWNRLLGGEAAQLLNLKKEGIFPLVHGVRSMALAARLPDTGTVARIEALVQRGELSADTGRELTESLHFFLSLRLKAGLAELDRQQPVTGAVDFKSLNSLERDLLKDTLDAVKRFKAQLRHRFRLNAL